MLALQYVQVNEWIGHINVILLEAWNGKCGAEYSLVCVKLAERFAQSICLGYVNQFLIELLARLLATLDSVANRNSILAGD